MSRVVIFLIAALALAAGFVWIAENPGSVSFTWLGYRIETSVMALAIVTGVLLVLVIALWTALRWIIHGPAAVGDFFRARRQSRGLQALSAGMIAANAGDVHAARQYAKQADRLLENEPLTLLLKAQAAQLAGDGKASREAFERMTADPATESIGLRGLYLEARRAGEYEAAHDYAARAASRAPGLPWAANALLDHQTAAGDWDAALASLQRNADNRLLDKAQAKRLRAVLLTAKARDLAERSPEEAAELAAEAHRLAPELVPAAVILARRQAETGQVSKAIRTVEKTWKASPHPDLAEIYQHARSGDSARDRLKRAKTLQQKLPEDTEGLVQLARAAIEAQDFALARRTLEPLAAERPTQRVCMLMAEIEESDGHDRGKVREWLARAVRAPRDPAWTADGIVLDEWAPVSPASGRLDAFEWRVPVAALGATPAEGAVASFLNAAEEAEAAREDEAPLIEASAEPAAPVMAKEEPASPVAAGDDGVSAPAVAPAAEKPAAPKETPPADEQEEREARDEVFVPPVPDDPGAPDAEGRKRRRRLF
ncbi:MAG: heme biosynthesis protein HemY [Flavobacteriaceae bacterium]